MTETVFFYSQAPGLDDCAWSDAGPSPLVQKFFLQRCDCIQSLVQI